MMICSRIKWFWHINVGSRANPCMTALVERLPVYRAVH